MIRFFDLCFSIIGITLLFPVFFLLFLAILITSPGPILFRQSRVGKGGQLFSIMKFRSMKPDSEKAGQLTLSDQDSRITAVGAFMRRYKLDELPQLINVLVGDMSIVGPRPEVPKYVKMYSDNQLKVLQLKPGITDIASLEYFNENALLAKAENPEKCYVEEIMPEKLKLNMIFIENHSLLLYFRIIIKTIWRIVSK